MLAASGDGQSRSPVCAARHDYRGRASGVGPATNRYGRRLRRLVRRVRAKCAACGPVLVAFVAVRTVVIIPGDTPRANRVLEEAEILSSASGAHARGQDNQPEHGLPSPEALVSRGTGSRRWGCRASPRIPRRLVGNPPT